MWLKVLEISLRCLSCLITRGENRRKTKKNRKERKKNGTIQFNRKYR